MRKKFSSPFNLVLDVGTTGVKAFVFDRNCQIVFKVYQKLNKKIPQPGRVEQNPLELLKKSRIALRRAIRLSGIKKKDFLALGITNQRETTILWNKENDQPVYPAIVWEDSRTKKFCAGMDKKFGRRVRQKTGLPIDAYFSASKIKWLFDNVPKVKKLAAEKKLIFGTVDSWLLWNFLENNPHLTDYTNACRTLLFNILTLKWDKELLEIFGVPGQILPAVRPSLSLFGKLKNDIIGFSLPVLAVCGDQQAGMVAAGLKRKTTKVTYGTGIFIMYSLGRRFILRQPFFTTLIPSYSRPKFALEAKIGGCGQAMEKVLGRPVLMYKLALKLAKEVDFYLKKLPDRPGRIVIDGGVTQYNLLPLIQQKISKIPVWVQKIYDGTALGIAMLMKQKRSKQYY